MNTALVVGQRTEREALSTLEKLLVATLAAMVLIWIPFQVLDIRALFPPIGTLYAIGSIIIAGAILLSRKRWCPVLAAGWGVLMTIPESTPAFDHLLHWNDIYTHFTHYLIIMTFFPLVIVMVATGIGATVQNYRRPAQDRHAPDWLRASLLGVMTLIIIANLVTVTLYAFQIP